MTNLIKKPQTHFALQTIASHEQNSISTKRNATMKSKPSNGYRVNNHSRVPLIKGAFLCPYNSFHGPSIHERYVSDSYHHLLLGLLRFIITFAINT